MFKFIMTQEVTISMHGFYNHYVACVLGSGGGNTLPAEAFSRYARKVVVM